VYQLLGHDQALELLHDRTQVQEVIANVEEITREHFGGRSGEVRPEEGFAACPAFDPDSEVSTRLRGLYEATTPDLYFGRGPLPTWDAICARVTHMAALL
jgi:hypothetical protein